MVRAALLAALVLAVLACPSYLREPVCGDGVAEGAERCDDANAVSGDGCSASCLVEDGWYCTAPGADVDFAKPPPSRDGGPSGVDPTDCWLITECGDGVLEGGEECEDGNRDDDDGCSSACRWEEGWYCDGGPCATRCGDGVIAGDEPCDDGNVNDEDGCTSQCVAACAPPGESCSADWKCCGPYGICVTSQGEYCDGGSCHCEMILP